MSVRLPVGMLEDLAQAAALSRMTTAHYAQTTLELAVLDPVTADERDVFDEAYELSFESRVHTTFRLSNSLRSEVRRAAAAARWPVNKYVNWALSRHLDLAEKDAERAHEAATGRRPT